MSFDMNALLKQAQEMQEQMQQMQEDAAKETASATAGGGMVTVVATAAGEITVELTQQSPFIIAIQARLLMLAGQRDEALALRAGIASAGGSRYVGPIVPLLFSIVDGDVDAIAAAVRQNIDAGTGATTIATSGVDRELTKLLGDARLGPLIRQLSLFAGRDSATAGSR